MKLAVSAAASALIFAAPVVAAPGEDDPYAGGSSAYNAAATMVQIGRYERAAEMFEKVVSDEPKNPDAFNLLAFSYRKSGQYDASAAAYREALRLDPDHQLALSYQGELFLALGDIAAAEANLSRLDKICWLGCKAERDLEAAIAAAKAGN